MIKSKIRQWEPGCLVAHVRLSCNMSQFYLVFYCLLFQNYYKHNVFNPFRTNPPTIFSVPCILPAYVVTSGIISDMNWLTHGYWSCGTLGSVELHDNIGAKYIKTSLELYFLFIFLCLYKCMHTFCVYLPPRHRAWIGCATRRSEIIQGVFGTGCVKSRYIYLVLTVNFNWLLL